MASSGGLLEDVTCSVCLTLFEFPKILPNCPHTFCLKCLKGMKTSSTKPPIITCPECRVDSVIGKDGITGFASNIVAQNIVQKLKAQQKGTGLLQEDFNVLCCHFKVAEPREPCRHCGRDFCSQCKIRHIEEMRKQMRNIFNSNNAKLEQLQVDDITSRAQQILHRDQKSVELSMAAVANSVKNALEIKVKAYIETARRFTELEYSRIWHLATSSLDVHLLDLLYDRYQCISSVSVQKQQLDEVAQLFIELIDQDENLKLLEKVRDFEDNSSWLSVETNNGSFNAATFLATADVRFLKLSKPAADIGCKIPSLETPTDDGDAYEDYPADEGLGAQSPVGDGNLPVAYTNHFLHYDQSGVRILNSLHVDSPRRIIIHPGEKDMFILCHGKRLISTFDIAGRHLQYFEIAFPSDFEDLTIDDLASDYRSTIFFTASVVDEHGEDLRQIYRIWTSEIRTPLVRPKLFAHQLSRGCFRGIATSVAWRWLLTTDKNDIVAYDSIDNSKFQLGVPVRRWYLGPDPYLFRTIGLDRDALRFICSSSGCVYYWEVFPDSSPNQIESYQWNYPDGEHFKPLKVKSAGHFSYWNGNALVLNDDGTLHLYINAPKEPILTRSLPTVSTGESEDECIGVAGNVAYEGSAINTCATIYRSGAVLFAQFDV